MVSAGDQNGLAGLLRIYSLLMKVPLSDLVDLRVAVESMTARAAAERRAGDRLAELAAEMADVEDRDRSWSSTPASTSSWPARPATRSRRC